MNHEDHIDFEKEVEEFIKFNYVKQIQIIKKGQDCCEMLITTLENYRLHLDCSTSSGIEVKEDSNPLLEQTRFEAFDTLLAKYSPSYQAKFTNDLFSKLQNLADQQQQDE